VFLPVFLTVQSIDLKEGQRQELFPGVSQGPAGHVVHIGEVPVRRHPEDHVRRPVQGELRQQQLFLQLFAPGDVPEYHLDSRPALEIDLQSHDLGVDGTAVEPDEFFLDRGFNVLVVCFVDPFLHDGTKIGMDDAQYRFFDELIRHPGPEQPGTLPVHEDDFTVGMEGDRIKGVLRQRCRTGICRPRAPIRVFLSVVELFQTLDAVLELI
jgi:hypothetical protein